MTEPVRWNCPCGAKFQIGAETTIHGYHRQPWFSHLVVECPNCNEVFTRYIDEDMVIKAITSMADDDKCDVLFEDFAPDNVIMEYAKQYDLPYIPLDLPAKTIVPRLEKLISFYRYLLDHGDTLD